MPSGDLRGKAALVAGGAGFLGSHLCDALIGAGMRVLCVDNLVTGASANIAHLLPHPAFAFLEHDVCAALALSERVDQVFNLACPASPHRYQADPIHTMLTNVVGTLNLLKLAEKHGAAFLQASTSEVYGDPEQHPQSENYLGHVSCTGPRACYDEGKRAAETLCFDMARTQKLDVRVARIFNTYGPRMQEGDGRVISNLVVQALNGEPLTIYGTGLQTRSFCFVSDMIAGLLALMNVEPNPGMPVNLGNPEEMTINEVASLVRDLTASRSPLVFEPLPTDDPKRRRPDIARARDLLRWQPSTPAAEGVARTIDYFRNRIAEPAQAAAE